MARRYRPRTRRPASDPHNVYEVQQHCRLGQYQVLVTTMGFFPDYPLAQNAAQQLLRTLVDEYYSRGYTGHIYSQINLKTRGLITRQVGPHEQEPLSEVHIYKRPLTDPSAQGHAPNTNQSWPVAANSAPINTNLDPETISNSLTEGALTVAPTQTITIPAESQDYATSFSQTCQIWPDRPNTFVPRTSEQYDVIMRLPPRGEDNTTAAEVLRADLGTDMEHEGRRFSS